MTPAYSQVLSEGPPNHVGPSVGLGRPLLPAAQPTRARILHLLSGRLIWILTFQIIV